MKRSLFLGTLGSMRLVAAIVGSIALGPSPVRADQFEGLWNDLGGESAAIAYRAIVRFVDRPDTAPAFLYEKLRRVRAPSTKEVRSLVADLDSRQFQRRKSAAARLRELGKDAELALRQAAQPDSSLELRRRAQELLEVLEKEIVRDTRAVEVLERIGNPSAREVLGKLGTDWPDTSLQKEVRSSLERLGEKSMPASGNKERMMP